MSRAATPPVVDPETARIADRNLELFRGFNQAILDDPDRLGEIPNGVHLVLLPEDDPEMFEVNLRIGLDAARRGEDVYLRHVTRDGRPK
jgi:Family of unknown function (DUF5647)